MGIEVYLMGSQYSRIGYYGKPLEEILENLRMSGKIMPLPCLIFLFFGKEPGAYSPRNIFEGTMNVLLIIGSWKVFPMER